jgi:type IV secretory pathway VirB2 component (pilin)
MHSLIRILSGPNVIVNEEGPSMRRVCTKRNASASSSAFEYAKSARLILVTIALLVVPQALFAQSPWERAAGNLERTFTGPLARSLALVAIVIGGLTFMFGEMGAKRQIAGIVFGGGLALFATQFLVWLF